MRLKQIKLAGFKSFVDSTTVNFPGKLSSIVGPNGCGKSNVIDGVRWVMGESSAKQLRGENATDVIFNGSSARKPTASASVELLFDNSDGRVGGQYAAYAELAIRREVTRDSQSTYFLNGQKCRRRDIQDVFLGTGFGPRSYSIIEQGMISQLVEAKPDDLRGYLEEAAGISKYKERRRETENRLKHTTENLARLNDIREELGKQLDRLQRQAKAAERYRELKEDETRTVAELFTLRHDALAAQLNELDTRIQASRVELEAANTDHRRVEREIETQRAEHSERSQAFNRVQGIFYQLGAEVSRAEETIDFSTRRARQLELDLEGVTRRAAEMQQQLSDDEMDLARLTEQVELQVPQVEANRLSDQEAQAALDAVEQRRRDAQRRWDESNHRYNDNVRLVESHRSRIEHIQQMLERQRRRRELLIADQAASIEVADGQLDEMEAAIAVLETDYHTLEDTIEQHRRDLATARDEARTQERHIESTRAEVQALRRQLASLEAVQAAALGRDKSKHEAWLVAQGLASGARIGENLAVVAGWERAVETVLGVFLHGVVVESLDDYSVALAAETASDLALVEARRGQHNAVDSPIGGELPSLASLLRGNGGNLGSLLAGVHAAESLEVAMQVRHILRQGETIITRDGVWIGPDWMTVAPEAGAQSGIIGRGQEIETLMVRVEEAETAHAELQSQLDLARERIAGLEAEQEQLQRQSNVEQRELSDRRTEIGVRRVQQQEVARRRERITRELEEIVTHEQEEGARLTTTRESLVITESRRTELGIERETVLEERQMAEQQVDAARQQARATRDAFHAMNTELAALRSRQVAAGTTRDRLRQQIQDLGNQTASLKNGIEQSLDPIPELQRLLEEKLQVRTGVEGDLKSLRTQLEELDGVVRTLESARHAAEERTAGLRETLETARITREGLSVNERNILERIATTGRAIEDVRGKMPAEATEIAWQETLEQVQRRIERLGAINLAAIDEFRTESERKAYLDTQNEDLEQALATLREAMRKIDRETRARFKETFETVNKRLGELFPKVFGGGHAYLELTGEDLLDTGVTLMARPPGKRNTSVHLLSGGEKAMTAISLIFAIFHLNPSPVCLLDEVDAPLDDANVARYAELIKEMSSEVQFIVITHNKLTMEAADHLMGVTMHEAGVSRLVSVDVGEAVALAAV